MISFKNEDVAHTACSRASLPVPLSVLNLTFSRFLFFHLFISELLAITQRWN